MRYSLLFALFLLISAGSLQAQTHSWNTGTNGNWNDTTKWSTGTVPNGPADWPAITTPGINPYTVTMNLDVVMDRFDFAVNDAELLAVGRTVTMNGAGQIGPATGHVLNLHSSHWLGTGSLNNQSDIAVRGTSTINHIVQNDTLRVLGSNLVGHANLTLNNITSNNADLTLGSEGGGYSATLTLAAGARLDNAGTFLMDPGTGGSRFFEGNLRNTGTVNVNTNATLRPGLTEQVSGNINVAGSTLLTLNSGHDFDLQGGTLTVTGDMLQTSSTFSLNGGDVVGMVRKTAGDLALNHPGTGTFELRGTTNLTGTVFGPQTVRVAGHNAVGNGLMNVANPLSNQGNLVMESVGGGFASTITMGAGQALTNQANFNVLAGAGGARTFNGNFINDLGGTTVVEANTTMNTGPFVNRNSWTVNSGATLTMPAGTSFTQESGTFQLDGTFIHNNGVDHFQGGNMTGAPELRHTTLSFDPAFTSTFTPNVSGSSGLSTDIPAGTTISLLGHSSIGNGVLTPTASLTNLGQLDISSFGGGFASTWAGSGTILDNQGTLRILPGAGGARTYQGGLDNHGTVSVEVANALFNTGTIRNFGTWTNGPTAGMNLAATNDFELVSGTFDIGNSFLHTSGADTFTGGTLIGEAQLRHSTLTIAPSFTNPATMQLSGSSTLLSDVPANTQLNLFGHNAIGNGVLTVPSDQTMAGTLVLGSVGGGFASTLTAASGMTLTNSGTLRTEPGAGGARILNGHHHNTGTMEIQVATNFNAGTLTNAGTLGVSSGNTLTMAASADLVQQSGGIANMGTFTHLGGNNTFISGKMKGQLDLRSSNLTFDPSFLNPINLGLRGTTNFTGSVASGQDLHLIGSNLIGNQVLNPVADLANAGNLYLTSEGGGFGTTLDVNGFALNNTGLLEANPGAGGARTVKGTVNNTGTVSIDGTSCTFNSGNFNNQSGGTVRGNGTMVVSTIVFTNSGFVRPGLNDIGTLDVTGNFTQDASGTLAIELGGLTPDTEHDVLDVSSTANLGGELRLRAVNGFNPSFGQQFVVLTAGTINGQFDSVKLIGANLPLGHGVEVVYTATTVTAQIVQVINGINQQDLPVAISHPTPGLAGQNNTFQISGVYANHNVELVFGLATGTTTIGACPVDYGIASATVVGTAPASATGNALVIGMVPSSAMGTTGYFQALDLEACRISEVMGFVFP
ncbi:MAG: beta strand repeat-containing protein [Planctomycetota bacterium]